jgi:hypothetical protein
VKCASGNENVRKKRDACDAYFTISWCCASGKTHFRLIRKLAAPAKIVEIAAL